ncbi:MAG: hypothetical protein JW820_00110 [Spirochaetales bacterium]|nr:hypothetical protein [Spirochaetales bacterium]
MEKEMNIENISSQGLPPETRTSTPVNHQSLIELKEIQTILYLGMKGKLALTGLERHRVDTFA